MINSDGREVVTVKKSELLDVLTTNRTAHRNTFEKALSGWKETVTAELGKAYDNAKAGRDFRSYFSIEQPKDQTKDYDRVIKMVQMSVDDTVTLRKEDFAMYVMDDWSWKDAFTRTTSTYIK